MRIVLDLLPEEATEIRDWLRLSRGHGQQNTHLARGLDYLEDKLAHELARKGPLPKGGKR